MNVLVVGSALCVWDDLQKISEQHFDRVIATNRMVKDYRGEVKYGVTVHPEKAESFRRDGVPMVGTKLMRGIDIAYDQLPYRKGSSGLYGVGFALLIGGTHIICAGTPLDQTPHYYPGPGIGPDIAPYQAAWQQCLAQIKGRVFSLSGWTRELLGFPL